MAEKFNALAHTLCYSDQAAFGGLITGEGFAGTTMRSVDHATAQAISDARWALCSAGHKKRASASADLVAHATRRPATAAAMPRSRSTAAIVGHKYDRRDTLTGDGFSGEGFDIVDGFGNRRASNMRDRALWAEGRGRKPDPGRSAPYSWRNYLVDGRSELGAAEEAPPSPQPREVHAAAAAKAGPRHTLREPHGHRVKVRGRARDGTLFVFTPCVCIFGISFGLPCPLRSLFFFR